TLAVAIGERMGFPEGRLRQLALGGLLHDVGKLSVPNEILNKPGRLTDDEFDEIRRHPGAGRALLAELGGFSQLALLGEETGVAFDPDCVAALSSVVVHGRPDLSPWPALVPREPDASPPRGLPGRIFGEAAA
ncbi:MAG TPA: HD domain-containing phosphohydrolase, partial [Solirubrobacteraceae bacterium]|nr:HD domain-containing phosphohydrolase [Solirubrobacteraceae bacterium]